MHLECQFTIKNTLWVSMQSFHVTESHWYAFFVFFLKNIVCHFAHRWDIKFHLYEFLCLNLAFIDFGHRCILTIFRDDWIFWLHMLLQIIFMHVSNSNQNIYSEKLQKCSFFQIWKVLTLSFHWKKNNAVGIFDRYATYFETKLIWASRRLVIS